MTAAARALVAALCLAPLLLPAGCGEEPAVNEPVETINEPPDFT